MEGDKRIPLYFIALASDADVRESASNLVDISNELLSQKDRAFASARATLESQLTAEREVMVQQVAELQATMKSQQQAQAEKDQLMVQQAAELQATMKSQQTHLSQMRQEVSQLQERVAVEREARARQAEDIKSAVSEKERLNREAAQLRSTLEEKSQQLTEQETALLRIYQSHGWKALACTTEFGTACSRKEGAGQFLPRKFFMPG